MVKLKFLPSCTQQPKTMSFRSATTTTVKEEDIYKIINSVYFNPNDDLIEIPEPWFTNSSESASTITDLDDSSNESLLEDLIRGARQSVDQRLFFEPLGETNSILYMGSSKNVSNYIIHSDCGDACSLTSDTQTKQEERGRKRMSVCPAPPASLKASVTVAVDSEDPYGDFKRSMEEMMESLRGKSQHHDHDWEALEEMLGWYLKANHKSNHGYIVGAFVDLLVGFVGEANNNKNEEITQVKSSTSFSSAESCLSSSASNT